MYYGIRSVVEWKYGLSSGGGVEIGEDTGDDGQVVGNGWLMVDYGCLRGRHGVEVRS